MSIQIFFDTKMSRNGDKNALSIFNSFLKLFTVNLTSNDSTDFKDSMIS